MAALLEAKALVKVYRGGKRAADAVDLEIEPGEIIGLLGPNGAGKSTTFRMICGLTSPTDGRVFLKGVDITRWPMFKRSAQGMGYLPQEASVFGKLTVEQNLIVVLEYGRLSRKERVRLISDLLTKFGIDDKRKQTASTLSGGERRRLEIARCLAMKPSLILLDEPFSGIDPVTIHRVQDIIADLRDEGIAILLTDHREHETLTITDRSYIICDGKVLVSGDAQTVLGDPTAKELYFGDLIDINSIIRGRQFFSERGAIDSEDHPRHDNAA